MEGYFAMIIAKKRIAAAFIIFFVSILLLTACGESTDSANLNVNPEALGMKILEATEFNDNMSEADSDIMLNMYGIDEELVEDAFFYTSTGATAEELAVIVTKTPNDAVDADAVNEITKRLQERVEKQRDGFADYVPTELTKLENPAILSQRNTAVLLIADDTKPGMDAFEKYFIELDGEK